MSNYKEVLTEKDQYLYEFYLGLLNDIVKNDLEDAKISIGHGFYTLFAEDAKKAGYDILNAFNSSNDCTDVYLKKRPKETDKWEQVRIQAAIAAMQGIMTNYDYIKEFYYSTPNVDAMRKDIAKACRIYADVLVKELKGE